jgi:His-Xaa-Ser system protein HxsD
VKRQQKKRVLSRSAARPARPSPRRRQPAEPPARISEAEASVLLECDAREHGVEPILGAAYMMTDRAYVRLSGDRARRVTVELRSKEPAGKEALAALAEAFQRERRAQEVRWAISKNNQPLREFVAEQAVLFANGHLSEPAPASPAPSGDQLTDAQRQEIERLIAEVEGEIKAMNEKKAVGDPKRIRDSWEGKQEREARP